MMERETYTADLGGERLDLFLVRQQPDLSRSHVQKRITRGDVLVDGKVRKANYKLKNRLIYCLPRRLRQRFCRSRYLWMSFMRMRISS